MALDKRLQNPKRSGQDPTELNAQLVKIEKRLAAIEKELEESRTVRRLEISDGLNWGDGR